MRPYEEYILRLARGGLPYQLVWRLHIIGDTIVAIYVCYRTTLSADHASIHALSVSPGSRQCGASADGGVSGRHTQ